MPQPVLSDLSNRSIALGAALASALLLVAALGFQAAGFRPCELCVLQRWPHVAAVAVGGLILLTCWRPAWSVLGMAAAAVAAGLALYHTGVELKWWPGPAACTGGLGDLAALSPADLVKSINGAQMVRCDQPAWIFLGLSMAAWNALISAGLTVVWALSLRRR